MEQKIDAAAISPVESILEKRNPMARFLSLFFGRKEIFARQWADKSENKSGYVPVRRAMTLAYAEEHLNGILVKLPLGIHRKSGKPSFFPECGKCDLESQLRFLNKVSFHGWGWRKVRYARLP